MKIFISYSHRETKLAAEFYDALKAWGHETWIDYKGISAGDSWTYEIDEALNWANVTIGIMTENAVQSSNVKKEWHWTLVYGETLKKRLILLKLDNCIAPHYFIDIDWIDFIRLGRENALQRLQTELEQPIEKIARITALAGTDPYHDYLLALYEELEAELDFLVLSVERMMDISAENSPDKVQEAKRAEKPRMLQAFSRRIAKNENPIDSFKTGFDAYEGRLLLLGEAGAGKTITILTHARDAVLARLQDPKQPLPLLGRIATWNASKQSPLYEWLAEYLILSSETIQKEIEAGNCLFLLDGLDELGSSRIEKDVNGQEISYDPRKRFAEKIPANNKIVISCRIADYKELGEQLKLNGAITLHALSDEQIKDYLSTTEETNQLWEALQKQPELLGVARNPLFLSLLAFAFRDNLSEELRNLKDLSKGELRDAIFEQYIKRRYDYENEKYELRGEVTPENLDFLYEKLGQIAMINAGGDERANIDFVEDEDEEEKLLYINENELHILDFAGVFFSEKDFSELDKFELNRIKEFIDFACQLHLIKKIEDGKFRFIHLLLRDHFVYVFCIEDDAINEPYYYPEYIDSFTYEDLWFTTYASPAKALGKIKDLRGLESLIEILENDIYEELTYVLMRTHAAIGLGMSQFDEGVDVLEHIAANSEEHIEVRKGAIKGLGLAKNPKSINILIKLLYENYDEDYDEDDDEDYEQYKSHEELLHTVVDSLSLHGEFAIRSLLAEYKITNSRVKSFIVLAIGYIGGDVSLQFLGDVLLNENLELVEIAARIISSRGYRNTYLIDCLEKIANSEMFRQNTMSWTRKALESVRKWKAENNIQD